MRQKTGLNQTPIHWAWAHMIQRCTNPNAEGFRNYGGRGITVCERWRNSFAAFVEDMGPKPSDKHTLERKDNSGHYTPENCCWETRKRQCRNRRVTSMVTWNGKTQSRADWADELGIPYGVVQMRYFRGWSIERMFTFPVSHSRPYSQRRHR